MMKRVLALAFGAMLTGQMVFAITPDDIIADLQANGYTRVEVRVGPSQIKVEAIRGTEKIEMVMDSTSGRVLKSESYIVAGDDNTRPGVSVRERNRDFVRSSGQGSDDNSSRSSRSDDDSDGHKGRGRGSDDNSSDDRGRGRGSDDGAGHDRNDDRGGDRDDD